ncbi:hypothetical protein GTP46_26935 [Duganella sp. FT135W]|uniref:Uncharacterized protein n=1 Tax=Duganella flavida TaxID=2692175 RepID=A0A6L8KNZ6_9BURK|nr:hypothetical protein [Duganella flavida]MYM26271.1 hypothetical protein [Duganella flavida]
MTSPDSDLLWSDAHGTYDISFLAASVRHDFSLSKHLDKKLTGGLLSTFSSAWAQCDPTEKKAYLLEQHELAHHALMYSTPAGVFNWRLNQTIFRDILFVLKKYKEASGHFPEFQSPRSFFNRVTWKGAFRADVDPQSAQTKAYVIHTIEALEKLIQLRAIFFGNGAATKYSELTMGELVNLMNSSYAYLMDRCDCSLVRT